MKRYLTYVLLYGATLAIIALALYGHLEPFYIAALFVFSVALTAMSSPVTMKFLLYLIIAPWFELAKKPQGLTTYRPLVSIIIPAWNEEIGIVTTIKTLLASSYQNIEIVIVNDGSTDNSDTVIRRFIQKYEMSTQELTDYVPIVYYYQRNAGKGTALNTGITLSHGEVIVCIDADCLISKDCILHFVQALQDTRIMAVCGNVKVGNASTILSQVQMFEYAASFYARKTDAMLNTLYVISGAGGAYRRQVFQRVGMYNPHLRGGGEDVDLSIRVQQAGMKIGFAPQAIVYTEVPTSVRALTKQRLRWTRSRFEIFKTYPRFVFSTQQGHNKILTCLVIPLIIFNDWLYILKMILKVGVYLFALLSQMYLLLAMFILITMIVNGFPLWDNKEYRKYSFLIPVYWLLSFIPAFIEMYAVSLSIWGMVRNRDIQWQSWNRQGVIKK